MMIALIATIARWLGDAGSTAASDPWAARIGATFAGCAAVMVAATNIAAKRNLGRKNGRGDMFQMLHDLQDEMRAHHEEQAERANTLDRRLTRNEDVIDRRLTGLRDLVARVAARVDTLEEPPEAQP